MQFNGESQGAIVNLNIAQKEEIILGQDSKTGNNTGNMGNRQKQCF
ncbi:MAG: hypothetical protein LBC03_05735 [Nitrososphaerota archaeon]|nr:hypothetical protein [Nitrososphaerota archaeon]